jgi:hypothetical protein
VIYTSCQAGRFGRAVLQRKDAMHTINQTYGKRARFDIDRGMTEDEIRKAAPSVFAVTAHDSRSERFQPIPTIEVLRGLRKEGFEVVGARQSTTRVDGKENFTKHLIRLRRMDNVEAYKVGDTVAEMLLKNANDGTSVYDLFAGLFRIRCLNSMVTDLGSIDSVKVRHTGRDIQDRVIEGTFTVMEKAKLALAAPQDWSTVELNRDERMAFAEAAHVLRFADAEGNVDTPIKPEQLLQVRRADDNERNLWTDFNVVQENVIRGGLKGRVPATGGGTRRMSTRGINGIDQDVRLNKALWVLGQRMAALKGVEVKTAA